ncbi:PhzF family isomerase [Chryseobacterium sp. RP-3-3]|uniref:PhzF family isomerase n=1 Tax=Chryseobacterium antibioticum TaxID=2728847 RepID=A0A7Y0ALU7_9FLAO|nr:PhzF family isomerase [Chryseobacterium antibioticum]NML69742.1 PhzF family isomerase [Chryseobacterium antibioticum]
MKNTLIYQIDSFTTEKFKGNPAGVVLNADGLSDENMQAIAKELNNSETAFIFSPADDESDYMIRYFTPSIEVPSCGHATIAALYAKALEDNLSSCTLRIRTKIGILPVEVEKTDDDYQITMTQGSFTLSPEFDDKTTQKLLSALHLDSSDLEENCPIQIDSTGHSKVMVGIKSREKLNRLQPDMTALTALSKEIGCNGYFVFTFDSDHEDILTYGRMFAPAIGITEDPVTGNANGPLGGYLVQNQLVNYQKDYFEFNGRQGEQINRLGMVNVKVTVNNGKPELVKIKGNAVAIFKTTLL